MIYYVDIDNTICTTEGNDYENAIPKKEVIEKINKLWHDGNVVIYWTARGKGSSKDWFIFTLKQLQGWGCRFNSIRMDKPSYDFILDDKAMKL
jgi:hypothetical protein